jgi:hypothetical protein
MRGFKPVGAVLLKMLSFATAMLAGIERHQGRALPDFQKTLGHYDLIEWTRQSLQHATFIDGQTSTLSYVCVSGNLECA